MSRSGSCSGSNKVASRAGAPPNLDTNKFAEESEAQKFLDHLKALGYKCPKHLRSEHLEYLFKDEKTAMFARGIMEKIRPENVLTQDEAEKWDQLKKSGLALYGENLEKAVERRKAADMVQTVQNNQQQRRISELKSRIQREKNEIENIKKKRDLLKKMEQEITVSDRRPNISAHLEKNSDDLDLEIHIAKQILGERIKKLNGMKEKLRRKFNYDEKVVDGNRNELTVECLEKIMGSEDGLASTVAEVVSEHAAATLSANESENTLVEHDEAIQAVFNEYAEHFDRLAHCIVYEEVRKSDLLLDLSWEQRKAEVMKTCRDKFIKQTTEASQNSQLRLDNMGNLDDTLRQEVEAYQERIRTKTFEELSQKLQPLIEMRTLHKEKTQNFFRGIYQTLESQKIRMDTLRKLLQEEQLHFSDVAKRFRNFEECIRVYGVNESQLNDRELDRSLLSVAGNIFFGICVEERVDPSVMKSNCSTFTVLLELYRKVQQTSSVDALEKRRNLVTAATKHLEELTAVADKLKTQHFDKMEQRNQRLDELERSNSLLKQELVQFKNNKAIIIEDNIKKEKEILQQAQKLLEEINLCS